MKRKQDLKKGKCLEERKKERKKERNCKEKTVKKKL